MSRKPGRGRARRHGAKPCRPAPVKGSRGSSLAGARVGFIVGHDYRQVAQEIHEARTIELGGEVLQEEIIRGKPPTSTNCLATHVIFSGSLKELRDRIGEEVLQVWREAGVKVVRHEWMEDVIKAGRVTTLPEDTRYLLNLSEEHSCKPQAVRRDREASAWEAWFGEQLPLPDSKFLQLNKSGRILLGRFDRSRCRQLGNFPLFRALQQVGKYLEAVGTCQKHEPLVFFKAAAMVACCARTLTASLALDQIPAFVEHFLFEDIIEFLETGTLQTLERLKRNEDIRNRHGRPRGAEGAHSMWMLQKVPGVGPATARKWYQAGIRTLQDADAAAKGSWPTAVSPMSAAQAHALAHHEHLTQDVSGGDGEEMLDFLSSSLRAVSGELGLDPEGWHVEQAGGGRREKTSHDCDYLVTHKTDKTEGAILDLYKHMTATGRLLPKGDTFCSVQHGQMSKLETQLTALEPERDGPYRKLIDHYDHIFGLFVSSSGRLCRLDVVVVPHEFWPFGLLGWTGSKQWLRFLKEHARSRGDMRLNSHGLFAKANGRLARVPGGAAPRDCNGGEFWPPEWGPGRAVRTEADIMELLDLPYREPRDRNC